MLQTVREKYPGVRVDVQFIGNEAMKLGLNNFALDVALTYLDKADLGRKNTLPIYTEQLSLLVSRHAGIPEAQDDHLEGGRAAAAGDAASVDARASLRRPGFRERGMHAGRAGRIRN